MIKFKLLCFTAFLVFSAFYFNQHNFNSNFKIITALKFTNVSDLDTRKIDTLNQALILRQLFSSLVEYDNQGQLVTGIAEKFLWNNGELEFHFSGKLILNNGRPMNALDAYYSLKRLIIDNVNLHGDLKHILCSEYKIKNLNDICPGISVENNILKLKPFDKNYDKWLLPLLASVDFRIIPKESIDFNTLKIINYNLSSGPYNLINENSDKAVLKANIGHYQYHKQMPQEIEIIKIKNENVVDLFIEKKINLIPTTEPLNKPMYEKILNSKSQFNEFISNDISVAFIKFSKKAIKYFTADERFQISNKLEKLVNSGSGFNQKNTNLFFKSYGENYISYEQLQNINESRNKNLDLIFKRKPTIGATSRFKSAWENFIKENQDLEVKFFEDIPLLLRIDKQPDAFPALNDMAFNEDLGHITFNMKQGNFGLYGKEADDWINNYIAIEDKETRYKLLSDLHYKVLINCYIYPVYSKPYVAITTKDWELNQNKFLASTFIWQMRKK